jgi:ribokinase
VILGSINMDAVARVERLPAPGETVGGRDLAYVPGGKGANQAVAAARFGVPTRLYGAVGDDGHGACLHAFLAQAEVDVTGLATHAGPSGLAMICVADDSENQIVVIPGANAHVVAPASDACGRGDVALSQLELPIDEVARFLADAKARGACTILNTAPALRGAIALLPLADIVVANETELAVYTGRAVETAPESVADAARGLIVRADQRIVVTLGAAGLVAVGRDGPALVVPAARVSAVDTVGAGDCFCGVLAGALAEGRAWEEALRLSVAAAGLAVQRAGAASAMPMRDEILAA